MLLSNNVVSSLVFNLY